MEESKKVPLWKQGDAYTRLLAAFVASLDTSVKFDYRKIAAIYGREATYDAIEGRFRLIRKEAAQLKEEVAAGIRPAAPPRGGAKKVKDYAGDDEEEEHPVKKSPKPRTPKQKDGILAGKVSKKSTPTKPRGRGIKSVKEETEYSTSSIMDEMLSARGHGFGGLPYSFGTHGSFGATGMDVDGDFQGANI